MLDVWRATALVILALAGCGSSEALPAPEGPAQESGPVRLDTRARTLTVGGETVDAGAGPLHLAVSGERVYVTDAVQRALLVFEIEPELHLQRRAFLPVRPTALAVQGDSVVVTAGERLEFTLGGVAR